MAAAHEQWRIYEVLVKPYNDLVELKELAGEATEQDVMDKVYKAWSCVVSRPIRAWRRAVRGTVMTLKS